MNKISVVINTRNEEKNIERCLESVEWADEIIVVDQYSTDRTVEIVQKLGVKVYSHKHTIYVEPARNFAISKASGDWILVVDADEVIPPQLARNLKNLIEKSGEVSYFRLPRKNIIFGKWIIHSRWWPDYLVRFFQKGKVAWSEKIHSVPLTKGEGQDLEATEENAIVHYHYQSISQFVERLNRYTEFQSQELVEEGYRFSWPDLISKPTNEFLGRFFAGEGYKDGLHGLVLASLQAFSELIKYLKVWEKEKFTDQKIDRCPSVFEKSIRDFLFWQAKSANFLNRVRLKIKSKI